MATRSSGSTTGVSLFYNSETYQRWEHMWNPPDTIHHHPHCPHATKIYYNGHLNPNLIRPQTLPPGWVYRNYFYIMQPQAVAVALPAVTYVPVPVTTVPVIPVSITMNKASLQPYNHLSQNNNRVWVMH